MNKNSSCTTRTGLLLKKLKDSVKKIHGKNAFRADHVSYAAQSKIDGGGVPNVCQLHAFVRRMMTLRQPMTDAAGNPLPGSEGGYVMHTLKPIERLRLIARVFDALERDYTDSHGSNGTPFPNGCEDYVNEIYTGSLRDKIRQ